MSNFLDKFNKDNYQEFLDEEKKDKKSEEKAVDKKAEKVEVVEKEEVKVQEVLENIEPEEQETIEEVNIEDIDERDMADTEEIIVESSGSGPTRGNQEEVVIDTTFKKKKKRQRIILAGVSVAVIVAFSLTWFFVNRIKVVDLVGMSYAEATSWAQKNKIKLEVDNAFSMEFDENVVMKQGQEPKSAIMKGKTLQITVSTGADPDEVVKLPDFSKKKQSDIDKWIADNKMKNVSVVQEFNKDVPKGEYIKTVIKDSAVTPEKFKRKDYAAIYVSKGEETFEKNISVPDFKGKSAAEVQEWGKKNEITIEESEQASNTVDQGMIISQSVAPEEKMAKKDTLTIVVSSGKAIVIPNYWGYTKDKAPEVSTDVSPLIREQYSDTVGYGYLLSQSIPAGTTYSMKDTFKLELIYSKGLPYIPNLAGTPENELPAMFFQFQSEGANITYQVVYENGCDKGKVIRSSKYAQYTGLNDHIIIYVSNGASGSCAVEPPTGDGE